MPTYNFYATDDDRSWGWSNHVSSLGHAFVGYGATPEDALHEAARVRREDYVRFEASLVVEDVAETVLVAIRDGDEYPVTLDTAAEDERYAALKTAIGIALETMDPRISNPSLDLLAAIATFVAPRLPDVAERGAGLMRAAAIENWEDWANVPPPVVELITEVEGDDDTWRSSDGDVHR